MAKSTKTTYKPAKKGNYKSVVRMAEGGNVSELDYSERREYIEENYAPFITDAQMIFSIYDSGIEYDYKGDRKQVTQSIIEQYKSLADYTESTLPQETIYEIQDWDLVRKEIDPDTDEVIGETPLEQVSSDNTYNFSYKGLVDLNWRVYHDEEYDRFFYVIMPHLGGDIRGNYGDAIILEGNDKEELFYRFYEGFISGGASIYIKFKDGSEIGFDSEQDSDVFYFRVNEVFEPTGMAQKYLNDFEKFDSWKGDEFLEETIDIYLIRNGVVPKMMAGGSLNDETPMAYIQVLGYDEGKWFDISEFSDGQDVINGIHDFMNELNEQFGGNREEYEVTDYEGFGDDLYDAYMGENEFDEIIESYEKYKNSDFPSDVIVAYKNDSGKNNLSLSDIIDEMDNNYFGKYNNLYDFGYEMVEQGVYSPSASDVYMTDTDKRITAGEESDSMVDDMSFDDLLNIAEDTKTEYEDEKTELEDKINSLQFEIDDLTNLQSSLDDDDEYEVIAEEIEDLEVELNDVEIELNDIDSRFEDKAKEEARDIFYDEIYDKLENDLESWLSEYGYDTNNLSDVSLVSVDYDKVGEELSTDYLVIEYDGDSYFFNNYKKGGRVMASKGKPKYDFYIVENNTKKLVSGYSTKGEAIEQRKLLVKEYPSMRFEIFTLGNLEKKTDLDVYAKKDYVELSTLDKIKKVSVDAYRYGQEKVGQAQVFLERNDVKGKIKRGARKVADKTKRGGNWLKKQWREADFGDGKGKAKFFADGGNVSEYEIYDYLIKNLSAFGIDVIEEVDVKEESDRYLITVGLDDMGSNIDEIKKLFDYESSDYIGTRTKQTAIEFIILKNRPVTSPLKLGSTYANGGQVEIEINELYSKSNFINNHFNWQGKLLEMLQDNSVEAYNIYQSLTEKQKEEVLQELYEMDNDMGSYGDGDIETSRENLEVLLEDAKNGNKYADVGKADGLFEIVVVAKGLEKDGGQIIKDRFSINSISVNEAKNIAKKMWEKEMGNSDFHIIDILTDEEYRNKHLSHKLADGGGVDEFEQLPFGYEVAFYTQGDYELEIDDFIDKLKIIHKHIEFDNVLGESDSFNTDLKFLKNGNSIASLAGSYNENTERYDSEFIVNDYSCIINFHPYNTMGGFNLREFDLEIKNAVSESKTYSAVVSVEGYEVEGQEFTDEKIAETGIKDLKEKTEFNLVRGKKFGQGKRVEQDRVINKFADGGESKDEYDVYDNKRMLENQANEVEHHAEELSEQVSLTKKVPAWVIAKMERATTDLSDITHYLDGENKMSKGESLEDGMYEILPHKNKFIVAKTTYIEQGIDTYPSKDFVYGFNDKVIEFDDIKSAQKFIDNIEPKYSFGKQNTGMYLMASELMNNKQQQQVVYHIPKTKEIESTDVSQSTPKMSNGGGVGYDDEEINDLCLTNLIELANELQPVRYYVTNRFKESDFESKTYKGRLTIVFKEPASVNVVNSVTKFLERAEDCHHLFEQSVNISGSEPNGLSINLLSDKFSDREFGKGGKVYDFAPKKINLDKTKKITTHLGDFNLALISKEFVYFVNMEESDENGSTFMYNKNGELLSDNYFASGELYETLERETTFDFIHPNMEIQRQEILKGN